MVFRAKATSPSVENHLAFYDELHFSVLFVAFFIFGLLGAVYFYTKHSRERTVKRSKSLKRRLERIKLERDLMVQWESFKASQRLLVPKDPSNFPLEYDSSSEEEADPLASDRFDSPRQPLSRKKSSPETRSLALKTGRR